MVALLHNSKKRFYECLAKNILETFVPEEYSNLILSDKPDLRMGEGVGIEVTRVLLDGAGQASGIFEHIRGKGQFDPRYVGTLNSLDYGLLYVNGKVEGYGPNKACIVDNEPLKREFMKKVNKQYDLPQVDLFMFSPMTNWFEEVLIDDFMQWTNGIQGIKFRRIMVFETVTLYICDTSCHSLRMINVDHDGFLACVETAQNHAY